MGRRGARKDPDWVPQSTEDDKIDEDEPKTKRHKPSSSTSRDSPEKPSKSPSVVSNESLPLKGTITGIANPPLKIASFNIQVFGERKMDREKVASILMKILQRYDLILILEIRDSSETAFGELVEECNKLSPDNPFSCVASARLGRTSSKEQYGFMYRARKIQLKDTYQFDDGVDDGTDLFQREPFAALFYSPTTGGDYDGGGGDDDDNDDADDDDDDCHDRDTLRKKAKSTAKVLRALLHQMYKNSIKKQR
ncbi:deoxyribonuclease-1-like [Plakobranchus ocellatus]|uniref:Deoxyribonuclease-1-like n=1 Tax=Plakobranchus ocellatus TaxID=259542 RepID=A0AAV3ZLL7_9GAST|nr:deoxyribonuclease-1-like [Plakobranchus ocellatus]